MRWLATGMCTAGLLCTSALSSGQSELERYIDGMHRAKRSKAEIEQVRSLRMSEAAIGDLRSVAELLTGVTVQRVTRDADGALVWVRAPSSWWRLPGSDDGSLSIETMTEAGRLSAPPVAARMKAWTAFLTPHADSDGSGFVDSGEAAVLRRRVELGFLASAFWNAPTIRELASLLGRLPEQVRKDLVAYTKVRDAATREGMPGFPALPTGLLEGA